MSDIAELFGVTRKTVYKAKKLYEETSGYAKRKRKGRSRTFWTGQLIRNMKRKIDQNPTRSIWCLQKMPMSL